MIIFGNLEMLFLQFRWSKQPDSNKQKILILYITFFGFFRKLLLGTFIRKALPFERIY